MKDNEHGGDGVEERFFCVDIGWRITYPLLIIADEQLLSSVGLALC